MIMSDHALDRRWLQIFSFLFGGWESLSVLDARSGFLSKLSVEIFEQAGAQGQDGTGCSTGSLLLAISFSIVEM